MFISLSICLCIVRFLASGQTSNLLIDYAKNPRQSVDFFIQNKSNVKQKVYHIATFNDVIFPFRTHLAIR